jgi:serine/threonine-protein kinase
MKRLLPAAAKHHEVVARFKREAYLLGKVESAYVAKVRDFFDDETFGLVLVMDFIEGPSLANVLEERTLTVEEAIELSVDLLRALVDLHGANIVHRDLKPGNIIMRPLPDGGTRAMIVDFGISRLVPSKDEEVTGITRANIALGTVEYMAPEQILNSRDVTAVTDLYAVGIILFRAVKGHHAFGDRRGEELARAKLIEDAPALATSRRDELADGLSALVARALKKKPSQRYPSAKEMLAAADALAQRAAALSDMEDTTTDGGRTAVKLSPLAAAPTSIDAAPAGALRASSPPPQPKPRPPTPRPAAGRPAAPPQSAPPAPRPSSPGASSASPNALSDEPTRAKPSLEDRPRPPLASVPEVAPIGVAPEPSRPPSPRASLPSIPDFGEAGRDAPQGLGPAAVPRAAASAATSLPSPAASLEPDPRRSLSDAGGLALHDLQPPPPTRRGVVVPWAMLALGFVTTLAVGAALGLAVAPSAAARAECDACAEPAASPVCADSPRMPEPTSPAPAEATVTPTSSVAAGTASASAKASAKSPATSAASATPKAVLTGKLQPTSAPTATAASTSTGAPTATASPPASAPPTSTGTAAPKPTAPPPTDTPPPL